MKLLSIETSCDETAVSLLAGEGNEERATFTVLGNALLSQIDIHREFGGVFPAVAKREHAKNLVPLLASALEEAELMRESLQPLDAGARERIATTLEREPGLADAFFAFIESVEKPPIDAIAVTHGPGLAPALWVGVNFAKALSIAWDIPVAGVNHLEGHILSSLVTSEGDRTYAIRDIELPLLALLISGGHTELVLMKDWLSYEKIGQTRDDAVGEAFDKVARMLDLPYPGGPEVGKLAARARAASSRSVLDEDSSQVLPHRGPSSMKDGREEFILPRPMLNSDDLDFSFSGLKTAVLYLLKERGEVSEAEKERLARAFEDAVADVLLKKTATALESTGSRTLAIGGGVSANEYLREVFVKSIAERHDGVRLCIPSVELTGDNAIMIGIAGFYRAARGDFIPLETLIADGNRSLAEA
ncbi:MAG TPA: tRNA (adenosine(37)-N6)-threonylcarbamoyltransferase complex transferase subunit TsaD [Candidatus Paceibacterota bacterium]|nr:tRNA (adenosine(37)-N6)-threonylcarbamoyltransferase complex transferase subunit TsaD [Candidatus Paceibacterota bacterium]